VFQITLHPTPDTGRFMLLKLHLRLRIMRIAAQAKQECQILREAKRYQRVAIVSSN
jgi:hypothetical protein